MTLIRVDGWERRLHALIETHRQTPFAWGTHDCVTFAASALEAVTCHRVWAPAWATEDEAIRALVALRGLGAAVTAILGASIDNWRLLRRGDIALVEQSGRNALTVCAGANLVGPGIDGLTITEMASALRIWRVG